MFTRSICDKKFDFKQTRGARFFEILHLISFPSNFEILARVLMKFFCEDFIKCRILLIA